MTLRIALVGLGGFIGSVCRYLLGGAVHRAAPGVLLPIGTLAVNVTGCLAIGLLAGLAETRGVFSAETRVFLLIGVLGGFTTFSTFGYETIQLLRDAQWVPAAGNVLLQVGLGIAAVWGGLALSRLA
jgi:CrcB protein